jgi:GlpG protein
MRLIGHLPEEAAARTFGDFLFVQGIDNQVDHELSDGWGIWVKDEDTLTRASEWLKEFQQNPSDPRFVSQRQSAASLRAEKEKAEMAYRRKMHSRHDLFRSMAAYGMGPLSLVLIIISVVVFFLSSFGSDWGQVAYLLISTPFATERLQEVRQGQVWRLLTPIFIHGGVLHIFFNMLWLRDLGSMIEGRQSTRQLVLLVLLIGICSNVAQYFAGGPMFGGMSGVVYGLLGYIWIRGKFDPGSGLFLHQTTVVMMLIWYVLCLIGAMGNIANTAHTVGLFMGVGWGYLASLRYR